MVQRRTPRMLDTSRSALTKPTLQEVEMAKAIVTLTQARLKELLHYDPETGIFTWNSRPLSDFPSKNAHGTWNTRYAGKRSGVDVGHGYRKISINNQRHYEHRLAWLYMTGSWPSSLIDHKNENGLDNRWPNLREATKSTNGANRRAARSGNKTGFRGVTLLKQKYMAQCQISGSPKYLGLFNTPEEAHAAYAKALGERFGEFSPFSRSND